MTRLRRPARKPLGAPNGPPIPASDTFLAEHGEIGIAIEESEFVELVMGGAKENKLE